MITKAFISKRVRTRRKAGVERSGMYSAKIGGVSYSSNGTTFIRLIGKSGPLVEYLKISNKNEFVKKLFIELNRGNL